jgi:hypothetical protein
LMPASSFSTSSDGGITHPVNVSIAIGASCTSATALCTARATGDPLHDRAQLGADSARCGALGSDILVMVCQPLIRSYVTSAPRSFGSSDSFSR